MDMNGPSNPSMSPMMMMIPWLHFGGADYLLFEAWSPSSNGAIAGACIGLFVFCIIERFLAAYRRSQELQWKASVLLHCHSKGLLSYSGEEDPKEAGSSNPSLSARAHPRLVPPFSPSRDIPRGVLHAVQAFFSYAIMLVLMTFNAAYIISIILGLGVGEVAAGRIGRC